MEPERQFSADWFSNNIKTWTEIVLPNLKRSPYILEIGSFEGKSTCWMIDNIPNCIIYCVDTFEGSMEHGDVGDLLERFKKNIGINDHQIIIHIGKSADIIRTFSKEFFDLVYIDGSHTAKDTLIDAIQSFYCLENNGIMIFDDYEWAFYRGTNDHPKKAIDCFLDLFSDEINVLHKGYQVIIRKITKS